jgi:hypothetical protein
MDNLLKNTSSGGIWNSFFPTSLSQAQARYQAAKALYQQIASDASLILNISTASLPSGVLSVPYSATLSAGGGTAPYIWMVSSGSLPSGLSLNGATGVISGTPLASGISTLSVQVADSGKPAQTAEANLSIAITAQANTSIWSSATSPAVVDSGPDSAVELGVKFRSDSNGYISGIRFFKASANTGSHTAHLWSSTGALLATAAFTNETLSGWQQADFTTPVPVTANTVYLASYFTSVGHYSDDQNYFAVKGVDNPPLHAITDGVSGANGVYSYGSAGSFPSNGWNSSNYWVDVVFRQ